MSTTKWLKASLTGVALVAIVAGCSSSEDTASGDTTSTAAGSEQATPSAYDTDLSGVCPENVVLQGNWWPQPDYGLFFQLLGDDVKIDADNNKVTGTLGDTGVNLEIRAGGPALGYQTPTSLLYQNDDVLLSLVGTDEAISTSGDQPTTGLLAWYQKSPQVFLWGNPDWDFETVADIGEAGVPVLAYESGTYLDVFTGAGLLTEDQIDTSYKGGPDRFVAADGNIVQQGFVTSEPYALEHETDAWGKPVKYLLVDDEYPVYQSTIAIRNDKIDENRDCLSKLIPLLQQAGIDYVNDPERANGIIVDFVSQIPGGGFELSEGKAADAVQKQLELGLVGNGPDGVFGSIDPDKIQESVEVVGPVLVAKGSGVKEGLVAEDLYTNEFLDPNITL